MSLKIFKAFILTTEAKGVPPCEENWIRKATCSMKEKAKIDLAHRGKLVGKGLMLNRIK